MSNMMSYFNAYKDIISEQDEAENDVENQEEQETSNDPVETVEKDLAVKFTNNLASEFTQKVNEFTKVCAQMVEKRSVDDELYDQFSDLYDKIKKIVEAAKS